MKWLKIWGILQNSWLCSLSVTYTEWLYNVDNLISFYTQAAPNTSRPTLHTLFICMPCHESVFNDNEVRVTEELLMSWIEVKVTEMLDISIKMSMYESTRYISERVVM